MFATSPDQRGTLFIPSQLIRAAILHMHEVSLPSDTITNFRFMNIGYLSDKVQ